MQKIQSAIYLPNFAQKQSKITLERAHFENRNPLTTTADVFKLIVIIFDALILQKVVNKMEETEHALYNRVRAAEMQRRKQEQDVQRIFNDLESLTKENQKRMRVCARCCLFIILNQAASRSTFSSGKVKRKVSQNSRLALKKSFRIKRN